MLPDDLEWHPAVAHAAAKGAAHIQLALLGATLLAAVAGGQALGHAADQSLHGADLVRVHGRQPFVGQDLLAQTQAAFPGIEVVLALHIVARFIEQGLTTLGQPLGEGLALRVIGALGLADQTLQILQAHLVQHAPGQKAALAGQADIGDPRALGRRLHGLGQARGVVLQQHLGEAGVTLGAAGGRGGLTILRLGLPWLEFVAAEKGLETGLETADLLGGLGQGGAQGVLQQRPVGIADQLHRLVSIDGLGRRDAHVNRTQGPKEAFQRPLHGLIPLAAAVRGSVRRSGVRPRLYPVRT